MLDTQSLQHRKGVSKLLGAETNTKPGTITYPKTAAPDDSLVSEARRGGAVAALELASTRFVQAGEEAKLSIVTTVAMVTALLLDQLGLVLVARVGHVWWGWPRVVGMCRREL